MTFEEFLSRYQAVPVIESSSFGLTAANPNQLRFQVSQWRKKGYLHALKRGTYVLDARFRKAEPSPLFIANYLLVPSYLSVEYALSHYSLIPERAVAYTSVTTKRTRRFDNVMGSFAYRTVKPPLFFGYAPMQADGQEFLIALPEKALLDFLYLNSGALSADAAQIESLRLQNLDSLDAARLERFAEPYTRKVQRMATLVRDLAGAAEREARA